MCAEMAQVASATSEVALSEPASVSVPTDRGCPSSSVGPASLSVRRRAPRSERQKMSLAIRSLLRRVPITHPCAQDFSQRSDHKKGCTDIREIARYFVHPISDAARMMDICPTVLKKICRKHGINRWPQRKVRPRWASQRWADVE